MSELLNILPPVFIASSIVLAFTRRLSVPPIPSYLFAGFCLSLLGSFADVKLVSVIGSDAFFGLAEAGASFLVFIASLKLNSGSFPETSRTLLGVSAAQIVFQHVLGLLVGYALGLTVVESFVLGLVASLSSSLVSLKILDSGSVPRKVSSKVSETISVFDDAIGVLLIAVVISGFAVGSLYRIPIGLSIIVSCYILRDRAASFMSAHSEDEEILLMFGVATLVSLGVLSSLVGLNPALGSFTAGVLLSKRPENLELLDSISSVRDFFSALFFVALGYLSSLTTGEALIISAVLVFSVVVVRTLFFMFSLQRAGYDLHTACLSGLKLDQVSEISLLTTFLLFSSGTIGRPLFEAVVAAAFVTLISSWLTTEKSGYIASKASKLFG